MDVSFRKNGKILCSYSSASSTTYLQLMQKVLALTLLFGLNCKLPPIVIQSCLILFELVQLVIATCSSETASACSNGYNDCVMAASNNTDELCNCFGAYAVCLLDNNCIDSTEFQNLVVITNLLIYKSFLIFDLGKKRDTASQIMAVPRNNALVV